MEFDKTSFEIELADFLEKFGVFIEADTCIGFYSNTIVIEYNTTTITPEYLRNGKKDS